VPNIYDVTHARNPTHIRTSFKDEIRNKAVVKTVYTGKIRVFHGAGDDGTQIDFQFPLLGFFRENSGMLTPGIIPIDQEGGQEFLGAAAMAALSSIVIRDTNSRCTVHQLNADLFRVDLAPTNLQVLAVVLTGAAWAREARVEEIDYHVTVLTGLSDRGNRFGVPILSNTADWNGTYGAIGASPVQSGRPTEQLP
jgi:hypothetical protein